MSDIKHEQLSLFDSFETMLQTSESQIIANYFRKLINIKNILAYNFEKYEDEGQLHYDDLAQYNRLAKMSADIRGVIVALYTENTALMTNTMTNTYANSFVGTGNIVSRAWGNNSLIGIIREEEINRALTNDISGLKWTERMGIRREQAVLKIRETIVQGLYNGESYGQMAERLNSIMGQENKGDIPNATRIIRTECYRIFSEAKKDRLDRVGGADMMKEWFTAKDERVRNNHKPMHGIRVPYNQKFLLPNGNSGFAPGMIGSSEDDTNCRCTWFVE